MNLFAKIALICAFVSIMWAQPHAPIDDSTINDAYIDKVLRALILGADCSDGEIALQKALPKGIINASDNATIDSANYLDSRQQNPPE
ncbi:hypothetical protein ACWIWK_00245 [Helicobacter sp. 23-1048]